MDRKTSSITIRNRIIKAINKKFGKAVTQYFLINCWDIMCQFFKQELLEKHVLSIYNFGTFFTHINSYKKNDIRRARFNPALSFKQLLEIRRQRYFDVKLKDSQKRIWRK